MKKLLLSAVLGGVCIALGGTAFLSLESRVLGALAFTVGLFTIVSRGYTLYTGRLCYLWGKPRGSWGELALVWLGNLLGAVAVATALSVTRLAPALQERAEALCQVKLGDSLLSAFVLAAFCNFLIYIAVEGYASCPYELGKYLSLFFGVVIFILCSFEHSVANMYYFTLGGALTTGTGVLHLLVVTAGNLAGGLLLAKLDSAVNKGKET